MSKHAVSQGESHASAEQELSRRIAELVAARAERMTRQRRRIHATPEPAGAEHGTTEFIAEQLRDAGIQPRIMPGGTGIVADIDIGGSRDTFVAIRAELDCVKVDDDKQVPYASTRPGLCHACGHDAHATIALNAGLVLQDLKSDIANLKSEISNLKSSSAFQQSSATSRQSSAASLQSSSAARQSSSASLQSSSASLQSSSASPRSPLHNIRLIFQPAEETAAGARQMIQHGAIDRVECALAMHVEPFMPVGRIGLRRGALTVACKLFTFHLRGRGGHSARPFEAIDPILAATSLIDQLYQYCPRVVDARHPTVLTIGSIRAGSTPNAIPDEAVVAGTLRTLREEDLRVIQQRMEEIRGAVTQASGCDIELSFGSYCPATNNDARLLDFIEQSARDALGTDAVQWIDLPSMGGEDFAFYQELIPGAIIRLGAALRDERKRRPLHSSLFDIDEGALVVGTRLMAQWALDACLHFEAGRDEPIGALHRAPE